MAEPEGTRSVVDQRPPTDRRPPSEAPARVASVPAGLRPVLIIEPESVQGEGCRRAPSKRRRDPLQDPEVVSARARSEALQELGKRLLPLAEELESRLQDAAASPARRRRAALAAASSAIMELLYLAGKAALGMAEIQLPALVRDAARRAFPARLGVVFRLPDLGQDFPVVANAHHLLAALTSMLELLIRRIDGHGEVRVHLERDCYFARIVMTATAPAGPCQGGLPAPEELARLRHLVAGLHQGHLAAGIGEKGEATMTMSLPLRSFEAEARS